MAKHKWCQVTPDTGTGNKALTVTCMNNSGRLPRSTKLRLSGVGVSKPTEMLVEQDGAGALLLLIKDGSIGKLSKTAQSIYIYGTGNVESIAVSNTASWCQITSIQVSTDGGATWTSMPPGNVPNDPGANSDYRLRLKINVNLNNTAHERTATISVSGNGKTDSIQLQQLAADSTISVVPSTITLNSNGENVNVNIVSNTTWSPN